MAGRPDSLHVAILVSIENGVQGCKGRAGGNSRVDANPVGSTSWNRPRRAGGDSDYEAKMLLSSMTLPLLGTEDTVEMDSKKEGQPIGELALKFWCQFPGKIGTAKDCDIYTSYCSVRQLQLHLFHFPTENPCKFFKGLHGCKHPGLCFILVFVTLQLFPDYSFSFPVRL